MAALLLFMIGASLGFLRVAMSHPDPIVGQDDARELPEPVLQRISPSPAPGRQPVLRITFCGPSANDPVLFELIRDFAAPINILHGTIDYIQGKPLGTLTVAIAAAAPDVTAIISRLNGYGLRGEFLGYVVASDRAAA